MGNDLFFSKLWKITREYVFVVLKSYRNQDRNYDYNYIILRIARSQDMRWVEW